jgi:putative endonuclease
MTNNLERRIGEHANGTAPGFTKKYNLTKLVYFEESPDAKSVIAREKQLKNWHREWKLNLIKSVNPNFEDLTYKYNNTGS